MDCIEELIENSDKIVVNYIQPKYTPKEQFVSYAVGATVGLICVGVILGTAKLGDLVGTAVFEYTKARKNKKNLKVVPDPEKD